MADARVERLAGVLVDYSTGVREGDLVCIDTAPAAKPLVEAVWRRVLAAGGHPHLRIELDGAAEILLAEASDAQLDWVSPLREAEIERADVRIAVEADANTRGHTGVDPARQARHARAREPLRRRYFERANAGELRSVVTLFPTDAAAQDADRSLAEYEDFVYHAGLLDHEDPVAEWRALEERYRRLAAALGERREIRVVGEGTDLTLGVGGRTWIPCAGRENFPDGELFTGPVETEVEGVVRFTYPASFAGRRVSGVELEFRGGEAVRAAAEQGEAFLREMLAMDDGARHAGEFSFGLNDAVTEFTGHTLFDEKIGGTVHLALGASYPESGGTVQSALHWDLVCDLRSGSEVYADGELVYRDGRFVDGLS
ncbi:MAG TPA: aminopeptidase [Gaiellaceae bacterium]|nr:aminopeptidase [Gaiellaceae bacterium]